MMPLMASICFSARINLNWADSMASVTHKVYYVMSRDNYHSLLDSVDGKTHRCIRF
jgi:hypothetical protein